MLRMLVQNTPSIWPSSPGMGANSLYANPRGSYIDHDHEIYYGIHPETLFPTSGFRLSTSLSNFFHPLEMKVV